MSYKTILTVSRDIRRDRDTLSSAAGFADRQGGHLSVLCLGVDRILPGAYYAGANTVALQQSIEQAQADATAAGGTAREMLAGSAFSWEVSEYAVQVGTLAHVVASRAQFSDLVVLPKPYGSGRGQEDVAILESALFGTRTPILVLPRDHSENVTAKRVVIGWNESAEAMAAIRAALPLLTAASDVNIAIVDPPTHGSDRSDPGGLLAEFLARHGVRADVSVLAKTLPRISDVLCRHATDVDADLVVMGAYGHSRLREAILGGATRNMLEIATLPVFMAH